MSMGSSSPRISSRSSGESESGVPARSARHDSRSSSTYGLGVPPAVLVMTVTLAVRDFLRRFAELIRGDGWQAPHTSGKGGPTGSPRGRGGGLPVHLEPLLWPACAES